MDDITIRRYKPHPKEFEVINMADVKIEEKVIDIDDAIKRLEISPIIKRFGIWVVTTYGLECLWQYYPIEKSRLNELWISHMAGKRWVHEWWGCLRSFEEALMFAREYFTKIAGANK